jgi:hypothetical protein
MNRHPSVIALSLVTIVFAQPAAAAPRIKIDTAKVIKPTDTVELDGGEKVSAKQYADELNQLQEALEKEGVSMRKADGKKPKGAFELYEGASKEKERDKTALTQKVQKLQSIELGGFSALRKKRLAGLGGIRGTITGNKQAPPSPTKGSQQGADDDDALDVTYDETLGAKKRAAIFVGVVLKDTGENATVGCDASLDGGVYVFDEKRQLVKLAASGKVTEKQATGSIDLYLLGKSVEARKGSSNVATSKAIAPPAAKMKYGWGPLSIDITGSFASELKLDAANKQEAANATQSGKCTVSAQPTLRASAKATASVSAVAYKVGVEGQIVLLDVKTPVASSIVVKKNPNTMTEDFRASVNAVFLDGDVSFFVKTRVPQKNEHFWDLDWDQVYKKKLFDWDGLKVNSNLANFSGKQTAL